jgi:hypothetical protein
LDSRRLSLNPFTLADLALVLDVLAPTATSIASLLKLLKHSRSELALDNSYTMAATRMTGIDLPICTSSAFAGFTDMLLLPGELGGGAVIKVAEGNFDTDFDIVASGLAGCSSEVAVPAEEAAKEIEGIMATATSSSLAALLNTFVAVLVVNFAHFLIAQDIVSFGNLDELIMCCIIATGKGQY